MAFKEHVLVGREGGSARPTTEGRRPEEDESGRVHRFLLHQRDMKRSVVAGTL
ncbi:MAG: hypothetical protein JRN52_00120 [Nitrososphaerota archaeon]|nr:hypothetical protein [Nitrososphaerota archaeon]